MTERAPPDRQQRLLAIEPGKLDQRRSETGLASGDRSAEIVLGSGHVRLPTQGQQRTVRWMTGTAVGLCSLAGGFLKFGTPPFLDRLAVFGATFCLSIAAICLYLKLAGVPSEKVPTPLTRESLRPDPDTLVWVFCYLFPGMFGLILVVWLFLIAESIAHDDYEPKLLIVLWLFLAAFLGLLLIGRYVRRKFPKQESQGRGA
jgi:hypothetical protein